MMSSGCVAEGAQSGTWTLWQTTMRGTASITRLNTFGAPCEVLGELQHSYPLSQLADKTWLHLFKDEVQPLWEDARNAEGGHLKVVATGASQSEAMWVRLVEHFLEADLLTGEVVNGVSVMANHGGRNVLKVWLGFADQAVVRHMRCCLRGMLPADHFEPHINFVAHRRVIKGASKPLPSTPSCRALRVPRVSLSVAGDDAASEHSSVPGYLSSPATSQRTSSWSSEDGLSDVDSQCSSPLLPPITDFVRPSTPVSPASGCGVERRYVHNPYSLAAPITFLDEE